MDYRIERKMTFRPTREPTIAVPFGARSVGHYQVSQGWGEEGVVEKNFIQLFWGIEGQGVFEYKRRKYYLDKDKVFIFFPNDPHIITCVSGFWSYRWFTLDGQYNIETVNGFGLSREIRNSGPCPEELFIKLEQEIQDISPSGQRQAGITAFTILNQACGNYFHCTQSDQIVEDCVNIIKQQYSSPELDINSISVQLGLHRTTLSKMFKKKKGISPVDYLISLRIQKALSMLKETNLNISEIAAVSGYVDPNYFTKAIKKATGLTPKQFREQ